MIVVGHGYAMCLCVWVRVVVVLCLTVWCGSVPYYTVRCCVWGCVDRAYNRVLYSRGYIGTVLGGTDRGCERGGYYIGVLHRAVF